VFKNQVIEIRKQIIASLFTSRIWYWFVINENRRTYVGDIRKKKEKRKFEAIILRPGLLGNAGQRWSWSLVLSMGGFRKVRVCQPGDDCTFVAQTKCISTARPAGWATASQGEIGWLPSGSCAPVRMGWVWVWVYGSAAKATAHCLFAVASEASNGLLISAECSTAVTHLHLRFVGFLWSSVTSSGSLQLRC